MTQAAHEYLELLTDFSVAAQKCVEVLFKEFGTADLYRPEHQRRRLYSTGIAQGDEILQMDICIDWFGYDFQPVEPSLKLREEMKAIMVEDLAKHFSACRTEQHRAFMILINAFLAQLSLCDLMFRQGKSQFQTQFIEVELTDEMRTRAEKVLKGSINIARTIGTGEQFDMNIMNLLTGETVPQET